MFRSRDELVEHHFITHNKSPPGVEQLYQNNGISSELSTTQQGDVPPAVIEDEECEVETSRDKSETIADNAAQRNGSLTVSAERDRRMVGRISVLHYYY